MTGVLKYRLLAVDLDGTLLDDQGRVPLANVQAMHAANAAGLLTVLCTGRGLKEAQGVIDELSQDNPLILANGALITDPASGRTMHRATLEPHVALRVVEHLEAGDDAILVLLDPDQVPDDYIVIRPDRMTENTRWWFDLVGATYRGVDRVTEEDLHHALRVGIVGPASHMPPVQASLKQRFGQGIFVQHFMAADKANSRGEPVHILEVFTDGVSKWSALGWLAEAGGIGPGQIAAIGDQINDIEMIRHAGLGIAMANAVESIKALAVRTTKANGQAGVAWAIDRLLDGRW